MFRSEFDDMVKRWAGIHYDWLPARDAVPKAIGAKLTRHQLQSLDVSISTFERNPFWLYDNERRLISITVGRRFEESLSGSSDDRRRS